MNDANTTRKTADPAGQDWSRFDAMTEAERHAAALSDPDAQPCGVGRLYDTGL